MADGLIVFWFGPVEGRHHDSYLFTLSSLLQQLTALFPRGLRYCIFADTAFPLSAIVTTSYRDPQLIGHPDRESFNKSHCVVRVPIEWAFGKVKKLFPVLKRKVDTQCVWSSPLAAQHGVLTLFSNAH